MCSRVRFLKTNYDESHITEFSQDSAKWFKSGSSRDSKIWLHFVDQTADFQKTNFTSEKKHFSTLK